LISAWTFSVAAWKRPGVEATCLELQNVHGQCPALLLWRCWTLEEKRAVGPEQLTMAVAIARGWDSDVVRPLRAIRERLKRDGAARATVRRRILDAELEAEHALLDALEAVESPAAPRGESAPLQALIDLAEAWRPPAPSIALARLVAALWQAL
jgi:uncharacterized protein (TIGR02444 family)